MTGSYVAPLLTATGPVVFSALTADKVRALKAQNKFEKPREARRHRRKLERNELVFTVVMGSIGGLAMLTGLIAMYIEASFIAYIAFLFPILAAPYSIHQRRRLNRMPSLVDEINGLRIHVNTLAGLNIRLQQENNRLAGQVGRLSAAEEKLQKAVQETGGDVNEFQRLVRENGETTRKIKVCHDDTC
jgi:regulator of replication initiation timing